MITAAQSPRRVLKLRQCSESAAKAYSKLAEQQRQPAACPGNDGIKVCTAVHLLLLQLCGWCLAVFLRTHLFFQVENETMPSAAAEAPATRFHKKRKADTMDGESVQPETKKARGLYQSTIAAPLRRARRSLLCMRQVGWPAALMLRKKRQNRKDYTFRCCFDEWT